MINLPLVKTAALLAPLAIAAVTAALTIKASYDPHEDELTIRIGKLRPVARAIAPLRPIA
jgi:hypothetical protein